MYRIRRLLLVLPVAALLFAGVALAEEPFKMTASRPGSLAPATVMILDDKAAEGKPAAAPSAMAANGCAPCANMCCDQRCGPRAGVFVDWLFLKVRNADVPYAVPVDDLTSQLPQGPLAQVSQDYDHGWRAGFWINATPDVMVRAMWTQFYSNSTAFVSAPEGTILQSLTAVDHAGNNAIGALDAAAGQQYDLRIADVDGLYTFIGRDCCSAGRLAALVGFRYGRLNSEFGSLYTIEGTSGVFASSLVEGYGPRLGLEGDVALCRGAYFYGSGVLSLLVAHQSANYLHADDFQDILVQTEYTKDRIVPTFDLELGVGMTCCCDHLNIRVGYLISAWGNIVTTNGLIQSVQQADFTTNRDNMRDNLTFDGFVVRAEFRW
jgi:hypothetical protein